MYIYTKKYYQKYMNIGYENEKNWYVDTYVCMYVCTVISTVCIEICVYMFLSASISIYM